jgi:hypothetical protein
MVVRRQDESPDPVAADVPIGLEIHPVQRIVMLFERVLVQRETGALVIGVGEPEAERGGQGPVGGDARPWERLENCPSSASFWAKR